MTKKTGVERFAIAVSVAIILFWLTTVTTIAYVVVHFARKWW